MRSVRLDVGTEACELEAHEGLDEGAGVAGDVLLRLGGTDVGAGAKADADAVDGEDKLLRHVDAKGADHLFPLVLGVDDLLDPEAVDLGYDEVEVPHAFGPVFLGEIDVLVCVRQDGQQAVMGLEIEADGAPHVCIIL